MFYNFISILLRVQFKWLYMYTICLTLCVCVLIFNVNLLQFNFYCIFVWGNIHFHYGYAAAVVSWCCRHSGYMNTYAKSYRFECVFGNFQGFPALCVISHLVGHSNAFHDSASHVVQPQRCAMELNAMKSLPSDGKDSTLIGRVIFLWAH